jgi:ubiquinol-cytochrome c reductase iron-sulfur subunit
VRRPSLPAAVALTLSMLAGLGLAAIYVQGGQPQIEGALLFVSLAGLGMGLFLWERHVLPEDQVTERRDLTSPERDREAAAEELSRGGEEIGRRRFLSRLLFGALGALGIAALFPIRSLGPSPGVSLFRTAWRRGSRLVAEGGEPLRAEALEVGSIVTVFPEGATGSGDSQTILIRVEPGALDLPADRLAWAPEGYVAYSKVCTHAGCPVGLYRAQTGLLLCPCHQSTFDVRRGAVPVFGPAARPLPQLPIEIGDDGYLRALGDFPEPVGPGFWNRPPAEAAAP